MVPILGPHRLTPILELAPPLTVYRFCEQHVGFSRGSKRNILFPDLALTLSSHPSYLRTISACSGPGAIMTHFAQCNITGPDIGANLARHFHVWRGSQGLGTLKYVRQAYHTWKKDMETDRDGADGNDVAKEGEGI